MPSNYKTAIQLVIAAAVSGTPHKETILSLGSTPQYLVDHCKFPQLPLIIKATTVDKVHFDHGMTRSLLERLDAIILDPKAVYQSDTVANGAVVVTLETKGGNPIVVALHPNKPVGRLMCNVVASVYDKQQDIEHRWQARGLLLWTPPTGPVLSPPAAPA